MANIQFAIGQAIANAFAGYNFNTGELLPSAGFLVAVPSAKTERVTGGAKMPLNELHKLLQVFTAQNSHLLTDYDSNFFVMQKDGEDIILSVQGYYLTQMDAIYYCQHSDMKYRDLVFGKDVFLHTSTATGSIPKGVGF